VPFSDLLAPEFLKAPEVLFSQDMFHPSAAGYALAAKQLLPALCKQLGEWTVDSDVQPALKSRMGDANTLLTRVTDLTRAVATHDRRTRTDRRYGHGLGSL